MVKEAGFLALRHPAVSMLLTAMAFLLMATNPVEVIWPTHLKPMLEAGYANTAIGFLTAVYFFSIACGASLSPIVSRIFKRRHAHTLAIMFSCLTVLQIALALQGGFIGFAGVFILYSVALGVCETPASSMLHSCVENRQRATMLSLRSLVQQLGAALGLIMVAAIAELTATPTAWMISALFLVVAALLMAFAAKGCGNH